MGLGTRDSLALLPARGPNLLKGRAMSKKSKTDHEEVAETPTPAPPKPKPANATSALKSDKTPDGAVVGTHGRPNVPCFDYNVETMKPNLVPGESVIAENVRDGVPIFVTSGGRKIFCCTIAEFEDKFYGLGAEKAVFKKFYPHAC